MNENIISIIIVAAGYLITLLFSGKVIKLSIVGFTPKKVDTVDEDKKNSQDKQKARTGMIIGKCENLLTLTFILAGEITGLALIFTAKSIVRIEDIKHDPTYYLGGTLVNFTFSVIMGFLIKSSLIIFVSN